MHFLSQRLRVVDHIFLICVNEEGQVPVFLPIRVSCKMEGDSVDHIFVQCEVAFRLWEKLYMQAGLSWEIPAGSLALLSARHLGFGKGNKAKVLRRCSVLLCQLSLDRFEWKEIEGFLQIIEVQAGFEELCDRVTFLSAVFCFGRIQRLQPFLCSA